MSCSNFEIIMHVACCVINDKINKKADESQKGQRIH